MASATPLVVAFWIGSSPAALAAGAPACPAAVQGQADQALKTLEQRQSAEDRQLRAHPTASYASMNGPVLRELEKRQQRQKLAESLQAQAGQQHHCQLQGSDF